MDDATFRLRTSDLDWVETSDETVVLDSVRDLYLAANSTATILWKHLQEGATLSDLSRALTEAFDVEPGTAEADVRAFLDACIEMGLVERV